MQKAKNVLPIKESDIKKHETLVIGFLKNVTWKPKEMSAKDKDAYGDFASIMANPAIAGANNDTRSVVRKLVELSGNPVILGQPHNRIANILKRGYQIGYHMAEQFAKTSGLDTLIGRNATGNISPQQKAEMHAKKSSQAIVFLFSSAYYIAWEIAQGGEEDLAKINMQYSGVPEVGLMSLDEAIRCSLYYYALYLEKSGTVSDEQTLQKFTLLYFQALMDDLKFRSEGDQQLESFGKYMHKLEHEDFVIDGFETNLYRAIQTLEIKPVSFGEIVGNHRVKLQCKRLAQRLVAYDFDRKLNPFMDKRLGGFPDISAGYGPPGTGKSMLVAAKAGLIKEYCEIIKIPFQFSPLPGNIISTFQGGSAERAIEWFKAVNNPNVITYAPIDDAENVMQDRTMQGVSSGVREFIGEFLRATEGASAMRRGNSLIYLMTNLLEQVDPAILSRIQSRELIAGATTKEDWLDQNYLWWSNYGNRETGGIINLDAPEGYKFMSTQDSFVSFSQEKFSYKDITDTGLRDMYDAIVGRNLNPEKDFAFHAELFYHAQKAYPFVTSREKRNVQKAVDFRLNDYDMPKEWFEKPEEFFLCGSYDKKVEMILEVRKGALGKSNFAQVLTEEMLRHLNTLIQIKNTARQRRVDQVIEEHLIRQEADKQLSERREAVMKG